MPTYLHVPIEHPPPPPPQTDETCECSVIQAFHKRTFAIRNTPLKILTINSIDLPALNVTMKRVDS